MRQCFIVAGFRSWPRRTIARRSDKAPTIRSSEKDFGKRSKRDAVGDCNSRDAGPDFPTQRRAAAPCPIYLCGLRAMAAMRSPAEHELSRPTGTDRTRRLGRPETSQGAPLTSRPGSSETTLRLSPGALRPGADPEFRALHEVLVGQRRRAPRPIVTINTGIPGPAHEVGRQVIDNRRAAAAAIARRIEEVGAQLSDAQTFPAHAERGEMPVFVRARHAARYLIGALM